jgi:hypothetical protein
MIWNGPSCEHGELQVAFISYLLMIEDNEVPSFIQSPAEDSKNRQCKFKDCSNFQGRHHVLTTLYIGWRTFYRESLNVL